MRKDGRQHDRKTQQAIRMMAMQRIEEGEDVTTVMGSFGLCRTTGYKWKSKIGESGQGLWMLAARKGTGRPAKLTAAQHRQVFRWIKGKNPLQYGFDFGLWTRQAVRELIVNKFDVNLSLASVGTLLAKLGLTAQTPLQRACQSNPQAIKRWQKRTFPDIARQARLEGADIYFWDDSAFRADAADGTTWGVENQTSGVERPGAASVFNTRGAFWFVTYEGGLTGELFVKLLQKLMRRRKKPVHMVVDGLPAHKKACVKEYVARTGGKLTLHFLRGHTPELNPDDLV